MTKDTILRKLIAAKGFATIDEFMRICLISYYSSQDSIGHDFITAPEISQMFGETVALWCIETYFKKFQGKRFTLVEIGAGNGTMMQDILRASKHVLDFHNNLQEIIIVENSEFLKKKQHATLSINNVKWVNNIEYINAENLILVANEFLDALPIKQFIYNQGKLQEIGVRLYKDKFEFCKLPILQNINLNFPENAIIEKSYQIQPIIKHLAKYNVAALFIDYGYTEAPYYSTLQAVKNHQKCYVLDHIGEADITAHVDFSALKQIAHEYNLECFTTTQAKFLQQYGIKLRADQLMKNGAPSTSEALERLIHPAYMGSLFKACVIVKP